MLKNAMLAVNYVYQWNVIKTKWNCTFHINPHSLTWLTRLTRGEKAGLYTETVWLLNVRCTKSSSTETVCRDFVQMFSFSHITLGKSFCWTNPLLMFFCNLLSSCSSYGDRLKIKELCATENWLQADVQWCLLKYQWRKHTTLHP